MSSLSDCKPSTTAAAFAATEPTIAAHSRQQTSESRYPKQKRRLQLHSQAGYLIYLACLKSFGKSKPSIIRTDKPNRSAGKVEQRSSLASAASNT